MPPSRSLLLALGFALARPGVAGADGATAAGLVHLQVDAGIAVYVDDAPVDPAEPLRLGAGPHAIRTESPCHLPQALSIDVAPGEDSYVALAPAPRRVVLTVHSRDADGDVPADVLVDGRRYGRAPGVHSIPACARQLDVRARGHQSWSLALALGREAAASVTAELVPDPSWDGLPEFLGDDVLDRVVDLPQTGRQGEVELALLVGRDGTPLSRAAPVCHRWRGLDPRDDVRWHALYCARAQRGDDEALARDVLDAWATARYRPLRGEDGRRTPYRLVLRWSAGLR